MNAEDFSRLQPPSRDLPLPVWLLVRLSRLEGAMFFLIVTGLLAWAMVPNTDWRAFLFLNGSEGTKGVVVGAEERGWSESKKTVWRVFFEFERGGRKEVGNSHFVGSRPVVGEGVQVEWPKGRPALTRIAGGRTAPLHRGALVVVFFPFFALMMAQASWRMASSMVQGMRDGVLSPKGKETGLMDPITREVVVSKADLPRGVEAGFDGAWTLDSSTRLFRPALMTSLGALVTGVLFLALFEIGKQI